MERWLIRLMSDDTRYRYRRYIERFIEWLGERGGELAELGPDGLVEFHKVSRDYEVLDAVQDYVRSLKGRESYKRLVYSALRSFFLHNRVPLPQDRSFVVDGDKPRVVGSLTVGEVKRVLDSCNECYRAMFLCMFQGGMGFGEVTYWSIHGWDSLKRQLGREVYPIRIDLPGRKRSRNKRPFYTFIGRDAVDALSIWLRMRPKGAESIFVNQFGKAIKPAVARAYWTRHLVRLGLIEKPDGADSSTRYGKNPHELRDLFRTRWQKSEADPLAAEFFMGHIVDPNGYNKAFRDQDYAEKQYLLAETWLNIISDDPEHIPKREIFSLENQIKTLQTKRDSRMDELETRVKELTGMLRLIYDSPELVAKLKEVK